ncbi:hypothetical protein [Paenibacillus lacisoli]|nr:hypothetical protein [Paenibacillus sp. JX-17]
MFVIVLLLIVWILNGLRKWLMTDPVTLPDFPLINEEIEDHPAVQLLEEEGYEVVGGKVRIPLAFISNQDMVYSRLYIDFVAMSEDETYLVKVAKRRASLTFTGPEIRDKLLPYLLMYPACAGLLYVDCEQGNIRRIVLADHEDYTEDVF